MSGEHTAFIKASTLQLEGYLGTWLRESFAMISASDRKVVTSLYCDRCLHACEKTQGETSFR